MIRDWLDSCTTKDEKDTMRLMLSGIANCCPVAPEIQLIPGKYLRHYTCEGCLGLIDGKLMKLHNDRHEVWVQDATFTLPDGEVVFWKDAACAQVGLPCCHRQSPCAVEKVERMVGGDGQALGV